jgi:hypothetical protein
MANTQNNPNNPSQQGAPQKTQDMPSSGNSPQQTSATRGTDEPTGNRDVERSGATGAGTQRAQDTDTTGDPGRTPGKAEGNENTGQEGNQ